MPPKKRKPKKESGPTASGIAGRLLREIDDWVLQANPNFMVVRITEVKTLCASVLSQDETKGQKNVKRRRAKRVAKRYH